MADDESLSWAVDLSPGSSVLIAGPAMTGKRELFYRLLAAARGAGGATAVVTTRKSAGTIADEYRQRHPYLSDDMLAIVDCVSDERGLQMEDTTTRRFVVDAGDLTGIGIHTAEFLERFREAGSVQSVRVGLHTLSTMLMYVDVRRVFRFVHVFSQRIARADGVGVFVLDEPPDSRQFNMLVQPMDGVVEVRHDATRQVRVRGIDVGPGEWTDV